MVAKIPPGVGPQNPQVVVLVGATGDLARRKLLPGLFHLTSSGFIPGCRIIGLQRRCGLFLQLCYPVRNRAVVHNP